MRKIELDEITSSRYKILIRFFFIFIALLLLRLFDVQIVHYDENKKQVNIEMTGRMKIITPRGTIYDANDRPLAISVITKSLYVDPVSMVSKHGDEIDKVAELLVEYLKEDQATIAAKLRDTSKGGFFYLKRSMPYEEYLTLNKLLKKNNLTDSINFQDDSQRFYPNGLLASQVLGLVNENIGVSGVEGLVNSVIAGNDRVIDFFQDRNGRAILDSVLIDFGPENLKSVKLTLDSTVQYYAEQALDKAMQETKADSAMVLITNPQTGAILAMASRPTYDPNNRNNYNDESRKDRPVEISFEPGSTFKPLVAALALESGKWKLNDKYNDTGVFRASGAEIKNWDNEANGEVTITDILKYSINTGMAHIGLDVIGGREMINGLKKFGFGETVGLDLGGESAGWLAYTEAAIDTATKAIGQGVSVTALQMVKAFGALANGGKVMQPHLIKQILNPDGSIIEDEKITEINQAISPQVAQEITDILEQEIYGQGGGGYRAKVDGYRLAGKTGTAQIARDDGHGGYEDGKYNASFIGYGPLPNPKFVIYVVINNPKGDYYGSQVVAPVFKEIAEKLVRYYGETNINTSDNVAIVGIDLNTPNVEHTPDGKIIMIDFAGWNMSKVRNWLDKADLRFSPSGSGFAIKQNPLAGTEVEVGTPISVEFGY